MLKRIFKIVSGLDSNGLEQDSVHTVGFHTNGELSSPHERI